MTETPVAAGGVLLDDEEPTTTYYLRWDDGHYSTMSVPEGTDWTAPGGATEITQEVYEQEVAAIEAANAQELADRLAQEEAQRRAAYDALIAAGIPDQVAQHLSGYTPPEDPEDPGEPEK